jgi:SecD/SecF fusion protein
MAARRRNLFVLLFMLGLLVASGIVIASKETKLGIDLSGGTELVYQGQPTPRNPEVDQSDLDRSIEIIRERIDELGVSEPEISRLGTDSISVALPDVTNIRQAREQVGSTAQLYFYDWEPNVVPRPGLGAAVSAEQPFPPDDQYDAVLLASQQPRLSTSECERRGCTTGDRYYAFDKQSHEFLAGPGSSERELFQDLRRRGSRPAQATVLLVPQGTIVVRVPEPEEDAELADTPGWYVLEDKPSLSGDDIEDPRQEFDPTTNQPNVTFQFTGDGREKFHDVTRRIAERGLNNELLGRGPGHFAVVLDDEVVSRPIIDPQENPDGIDGRTGAQISGSFTIQEAQDLATNLQIGALPVPLKLISQSTVSATLGEQALDQGLRAGIVGLILVILFLLLYYRFLGLVAAIGLGVYGAIFFALIELIPVTMTLPGIAGLILTIGVAADSNIVIFERIKEEVRSGRSLSTSIAVGYRRGIATIVDANVITLFTAFILFVLATSGVKGFALTLGVGTIVSLLTAVVFTQALLGAVGRGRLLSSARLFGAGEKRTRWHFDFTGLSRWFFSMSGVILLVGTFALATNQLNLGIDFESGTRINVGLAQAADEDAVRDSLSRVGVDDAEIQEIDGNEALGDNAFQIESRELQPDQVTDAQGALQEDFGIERGAFENSTVGPTFGEEIARSAVIAIIFSLLLISGYVALRFEPKYAVPVLIAVAHDILITAGVYSLSEREVTSSTVAAFLTILGYSLYDTVIVFDRIRENVPRMPRAAFSQIVNRSMSEVLTRSLITGLSSVFLVGVLLIFGGETLKDFAFAMLVGIASGTYSSIFIASPVLTAWKEREPGYQRRRARIEGAMGRVPAFADEMEVGRIPAEEELEEEERVGVAAPPKPPSRARPPAPPEPASREVEATGAPTLEGDGAQGPEETEPERLVGAGASAQRRQKNAKRRRQRQRRRKHGRNR